MKNKITALALIAVTALSLAPKPAQASDKTLAVIGGFIGGVLVASELNHNHGYEYASAPVVVVNDRHNDGYWRVTSVRVWVDSRWICDGYDRRGREIRRFIGGHYEYRTERQWVSAYGYRDQRDCDVRYGYGR